MKSGKPPSRKVLTQLALGVEGIIDEFGGLGFSRPEDTSRTFAVGPNFELNWGSSAQQILRCQ
jgi:hypothetical protein